MITIPAKVQTRLTSQIKPFQAIVSTAKAKDVNESDTVTIINDILCSVFGYDKYTEITSEYAIKKTFCDLAIRIGGVVKILVEVKAAGLTLKENHIKQAVDYGANAGIEWVILTNSVEWKVYKIVFSKPIDAILVYNFDFTEINVRKQSDLESLYYITREAMTKGNKSILEEVQAQQQIVNKFTVSQIILADSTLETIRKFIRKMSPEAKVTNEEIQSIIYEEIIKRDVLDDEKMPEAKKKVSKILKSTEKPTAKTKIESETGE
jgi:predicted type IV restriction endonuclease